MSLAILTLVMFAGLTSAGGVAGAVSLAPAGGEGSIGLRLVDVPADAVTDPRALLYIVDHLAPGAVIHRRIEVSNTTTGTVHVQLYAAAATLEHGTFLGADGNTPNDLSNWTSVAPDAVDVPSGGVVTATVTIAVPDDAPPGEQYGVVWAETRTSPPAGQGVTQVNRVGLRLYVSIGPGGAPAADFTIDALTATRADDGHPVVLASVHNRGGRALDMSGTLQLLNGPGALAAGPFSVTLGTTLAIGDTEAVTIALNDQLPAGPWDAVITLRSGLVERTARATITFPANAGASLPVPTSGGHAGGPFGLDPAVLWGGAAGGMLIVSVCFVQWYTRRSPRPALV